MDLRAGLHRLAFVVITAAILVVSSERIFWYWASSPLDFPVTVLVYAPAAGGLLWLLSRFRVRDLVGVLLIAPVFGYLIEGVITPIMYTGGPFVPFFPAWFAVWHGVLGFVVLWYLFRRWSIEGRWGALLGASAAMGVFWGSWAMTMVLEENRTDEELVADMGGPLNLLGPTEFALYAGWVGLALVVAHWLLARIGWMTSFEPARLTRWVWLGSTAAVVVAWTVGIFWAAPMFVAYAGLQVWALRRRENVGSAPTVLEQLQGRVPMRSLAPMSAMPIAAALTYTMWWNIAPPHDLIRVFMYWVIGVQSIAGAIMMAMTLGRAWRDGRRKSDGESLWDPPSAATLVS